MMSALPPESPPPPRVSVIIRSFSRTDEIPRLIEKLAAQTLRPLEIVDIDSGSSPDVIGLLRDWAREGVARSDGPIPLRLIEIPNRDFTSAGALNQAIRAAQGDLMAIISQDAEPTDAQYLARLANGFSDPTVAATYARQILGDTYYPLGEKDLLKTYPPESRIQRAPDCWLVNTCSMVRRDLWQRHPFQDHAFISEDHEWGKWAQDEGFTIRYEADAVVRHYHHFPRLRQLWERYFFEGRGLAYIHKKTFSLPMAVYSYMREVASDGVWLTRRGMPWHWLSAVWRRGVKYTALYCGHRAQRRQDS